MLDIQKSELNAMKNIVILIEIVQVSQFKFHIQLGRCCG